MICQTKCEHLACAVNDLAWTPQTLQVCWQAESQLLTLWRHQVKMHRSDCSVRAKACSDQDPSNAPGNFTAARDGPW